MSSAVPEDSRPVRNLDDLVQFLAEGEKPASQWVIGLEHEKIGWCPQQRRPPDYPGGHGIGKLFEGLEARLGWAPILDGGVVIGLAGEGASITLEPGGQLELSGAPLRSLADAETEIIKHLHVVREVSDPIGIQWSALGLMPWGQPEDMPLMPKSRYPFLEQYVRREGKYGLHMMRQTATAQANLDFGDEEDAWRKMRVGLFLQPLVMALFANSPVVDGALTAYQSFRAHIWTDVAPSRCRLPEQFFNGPFGYLDYVRWAVDVPMLFIHRHGAFRACDGMTFRAFMDQGHQGHIANLGDWSLHLSTVFPDVRLKQHLEVRGADMCMPSMVLALGALHMGLLYDTRALNAALQYFDGWRYEDWALMRQDVSTEGLALSVRGRTLSEHGLGLLALAEEGLERWEPGAVRFLEVLGPLLRRGACPADDIRTNYAGDPEALLAQARIA